MIAKDAPQREAALDMSRSVIVEAPAGSGKTSLLTQRFLSALALVDMPERVLAITFTRKAAAEMRSRVIDALHAAQGSCPSCSYQAQMWQKAKAVHARSESLNWSLLQNPHRLKIMTIDALCASLVEMPEVTDMPVRLYNRAVEQVLTSIRTPCDWAEDCTRIIAHLDNRYDSFAQLMVALLGVREQWLPLILHTKDMPVAEVLQQSCRALAMDWVDVLQRTYPPILREVTQSCFDFAHEQLGLPHYGVSLYKKGIESVIAWRALAQLLLTKEGTLRRKVDKRCGFPAGKEFAEEKATMQHLLAQLAEEAPWLGVMASLQSLPDMSQPIELPLMASLSNVLPVLAAFLKLSFQEAGQVDFTEVALSATAALNQEVPSELNLLMDVKLSHLLVDEFQDTSVMQFDLLTQLVSGWTPDDGRTLFLVGDPMQSIYRFRQAEVSLFERVKTHGIGHVHCDLVTLASNFRSSPSLIAPINTIFSSLCPSAMMEGEVAYTAAVAEHRHETEGLHAVMYPDSASEAIANVEQIQVWLHAGMEEIAVLVRSKAHAVATMQALKFAQVPYQAIDLNVLGNTQVVMDVMSLTFALEHLGDRLSWLSILRAPWCGLTLDDCLVLAEEEDTLIWNAMRDTDKQRALSDEGQKRLAHMIQVLSEAMAARGEQPFYMWVRNTWEQLGGPECLMDPHSMMLAREYFERLSALENMYGGCDRESILRYVTEKSVSQPSADAKVQLLTIHKAKGLEFDAVIIPAMDASVRAGQRPLLAWLTRWHPSGMECLMAPHAEPKTPGAPLYEALLRIEKFKRDQENLRVMYVGMTRAKKSCVLTAVCEDEEAMIRLPKSSFMRSLLPFIESNELPVCWGKGASSDTIHQEEQANYRLPLSALPIQSDIPDWLTFTSVEKDNIPEWPQEHPVATKIGTAVHMGLRMLAETGRVWESLEIRRALWAQGVVDEQMREAVSVVQRALENTQQDSKGQWILSQDHPWSATEFPLIGQHKGKCERHIIDRLILTQNEAWVIDYKVVLDEHSINLDRYTAQMQRYINVCREWLGSQYEIRAGIYLPLQSRWEEVEHRHVGEPLSVLPD